MSRVGDDAATLLQRFRLTTRMAMDAYTAGRIDVALGGYRKAVDLAAAMGVEGELEDCRVWVGTCLFNLGRAEESLASLGEILQRLELPTDDALALDARCTALKYWLWLSTHHRGRRQWIEDLVQRGRAFLRDRALASMEDSFCLVEALVARYRGEFTQAIALADRAVGAYREGNTLASFVPSEYLRVAARVRLETGVDLEVVEEIAREMLTSDRATHFAGPIRARQLLARAALVRGELANALTLARDAEISSRSLAHPSTRAESLAVLARVWQAHGEPTRAGQSLQQAQAQADAYHSELLRFDLRFQALELADAGPPDDDGIARVAAAAWQAATAIDLRLETNHNRDAVRARWPARAGAPPQG